MMPRKTIAVAATLATVSTAVSYRFVDAPDFVFASEELGSLSVALTMLAVIPTAVWVWALLPWWKARRKVYETQQPLTQPAIPVRTYIGNGTRRRRRNRPAGKRK